MSAAAAPARPRVLFVHPPVKLPKVFAHYPTLAGLGLLHNAAVVEAAGFEVRVSDALLLEPHLGYRPLRRELYHLGASLERVAEDVAAAPADAVVVVATMFSDLHRLEETYLADVVRLARRAHPGAPVVVADCHVCGMNYFSYDPVALLTRLPEIDAVVLGEGDAKLVAALRRLLAGSPLGDLPEIAWRAPGGPVRNPGAAAPTRPLDDLPYPAFHLIDMERFFACQADAVRHDLVHEYHEPIRFVPLLTSRGCPYSCSFCTQQVLGHPWRAHSVGYLATMLRELRARYGVERFFFLDNNITVDPRRFDDLVALLADEHLPWDALNGFRADGLTDQAIAHIHRAGNAKITVSAESGDPEVLRGLVGKRLDLKAVVRVARTARALGVPSQVHYVIGLPGETRPQINNTLEFATMLHEELGALPLLQHAIPFRGTALYRTCEERGWFDPHPDHIPLFELETRPVIRTPDFTPAEVLRFKANAYGLINARERCDVVDVGAPCNNRCRHCERPAAGAAPEEAVLLAAVRARRRAACELIVTGGEPTLAPDALARLISAARAAGYRQVTVATNGRMLAYPGLAGRLADAGLGRIVTTVSAADAAVHDALTCVPGSWRQTLAGVERARAAGISVEVNVPVTRAGLPGLAATARLLAARGIRVVHLRYPAPRGRVLEHPDLVPTYAEALPILLPLLRAPGGLDLTVQGVPFCVLPRDVADRAAPLPFWLGPALRPLKAKHDPRCRGCTELVGCLGPWREEHEALYGQAAVLPPHGYRRG